MVGKFKLVAKVVTWFLLPFIGVCALVWGVLFLMAREEVRAEWNEKFPYHGRNPAEVRGLVTNLVSLGQMKLVPSFAPKHMWEEAVCVEAVAKGVNALLDRDVLRATGAWEFREKNPGLKTIFDRNRDFEILDGKVFEITKANRHTLSEIFCQGKTGDCQTDRLYVIGSRFRATRADPLIVKAKKDVNSHVMILLGRYDGRWMGYHMFHAPEDPEGNPFRVDDMEEALRTEFALVWVAEVPMATMSPIDQGLVITFQQNLPQYRALKPMLGVSQWWLPGRICYYYWDMVAAEWSWGDNFPTVQQWP